MSKGRAQEIFLGNGPEPTVAEERELARIALDWLALRERAEPVEPVWRAKKYPVNRPIPGSQLVVWDETGKFVGYGSAVDTRKSGVAIQMSDGCRFDSNHLLRWEYALQAPPAPVAAGWIACSERMPEREYVLAADFSGAYYLPSLPNTQVGIYADWFEDGKPSWDDGDGNDLHLKQVTHWMPLPAAPGKN
ncbi:DUF551 domain-containing protein [Cronobacter sakazakii]|uniref:DUF551 domain-containing protein n=1 Tax=Cronobacter sakazakii TaxID=28141 RepID=UPI0020A6D82A|nr:DUF551 domain-containing protein [Cronobacter sakazakii]